jgi:GT2 family glycosyltransferase
VLASVVRRGHGRLGGAGGVLTGAKAAMEKRCDGDGRWWLGASHHAGAREWERA